MEIIIAGVVMTAVMWLLSRIGKGAVEKGSGRGSAVQEGVVSGKPAEAGNNDNSGTMESKKQELGTKDLFLRVLTELGCPYEMDEDDNDRIIFGYQGENFEVYANNENAYVCVRDPFWLRISQEDIDEMARLRRVINDSNIQNSVTTVYTLWDEDKSFNIHSQRTFIFLSQLPDLTAYLRSVLNWFFHTKQFILTEMEKLRKQEESAE